MKQELPPIDDDLSIRRPNLKALQGGSASDAEVDANSRLIGSQWGASTSLAPTEEKVVLASLRIEIPDYLDLDLARNAVEKRVTKQYLVLKALQQAGYHIEPHHLVEDKRKTRTRRK